RLWHEINYKDIGTGLTKDEAALSEFTWFPYNKGGSFRRWYGNRDYVINWYKDGSNIKRYKLEQQKKNSNYNIAIAALSKIFKPQISWSSVTAGPFSARHYEKGFLFDVSGSSLFVEKKDTHYLLGLLNSKVANRHLNVLNPTINYQPGNIKDLIFIKRNEVEVSQLVEKNINISKEDWDFFETSWDFKKDRK